MRALGMCIVALCLAVSPALTKAAGTGANDSPSSNDAKSTASTAQPGNAPAADPKANGAAKAEPSSSELESELQELRDLIVTQSKQIQSQQEKMEMLEEQLNAAAAAKEGLTADPAESASAAAINPVVGAIATGSGSAQGGNPEEPTSLHYKGVTLTPGGFMAAETVWRQKALAADVNTPFGSTPFNGSPNAHMSEFNASGRQSRISMLVEGKLANVKIGGYYETDFLSAGTTSTIRSMSRNG